MTHDTIRLRGCEAADAEHLIALAVETFGPFMSAYLAHVGPVIFAHERTDWQGEYERTIPAMHDPGRDRHVVVAEQTCSDGRRLTVGFVAYELDAERRHGTLVLVAVSAAVRRRGVGVAMCRHAMADLRGRGAEVVDVGTGGDAFHEPARRLYERLGFMPVPVVHYVREL